MEMRELSEDRQIKARLERIEEQLDGITQAEEDIYRQLQDLTRTGGQRDSKVDSRLTQLEQESRAAAAERKKMREDLVETLSRRVAEVINAPADPPGRTERGYEHTVKEGETLSEIAAAYGVTVEAIARANGISNPNSIRAGGKLFIPE